MRSSIPRDDKSHPHPWLAHQAWPTDSVHVYVIALLAETGKSSNEFFSARLNRICYAHKNRGQKRKWGQRKNKKKVRVDFYKKLL